MTSWVDVVARVRGLSSQLLDQATCRSLCGARDLAALGAQLASTGALLAPPREQPVTAPAIELALRRRASARLRVVARWAGPRATRLAPLFADEDLRSLRALVRGVVAGTPADDRVAGLIATPSLPVRALAQLAATKDLGAVGALLAIWRHPMAVAIAPEARRAHPDLFRIDSALTRAFAERAEAAGRRADAPMREFVRLTIDLENLWTAFALTEAATDAEPERLFVAGGAVVIVADLSVAAQSRAAMAVASAIRPRAVRTPLAAALDGGARAREDRALDALVRHFRHLALCEPLSTAPIIGFVLRQRAELRTALRITWGIALGASRAHLESAIGVAA